MTTIATPSNFELAANHYLRCAQEGGKLLGLPAFTGADDDDALHEIADSALSLTPCDPVAEQLAADLFAYRLIRDTADLHCHDTAEHRRRLIREALCLLQDG
jgi:hypothetical protein